jgi:hypothetical protein
VHAQATGQCAEVQHQRGVRKRELGEIDDHVPLRADRSCESLPPVSLGRPVLVASTTQGPGGVIELDDPGKLQNEAAGRK